MKGEPGVGKETFARACIAASDRQGTRRRGPCDAALLAGDAIERALSATLAVTGRPGKFAEAHGGVLYLEDIGALTLPAQSRLLRALQQGETERAGGGSRGPG